MKYKYYENDSDQEANTTIFYKNLNYTSYMTGIDCNKESDGVYWFNAADADSTDNTTIYMGKYELDKKSQENDTDSEDARPKLIITNLTNPNTLILDDEDPVTYYIIGDNIYRYDEDSPDDDLDTGLFKEGLDGQKALFFYKDSLYMADEETLFQLVDYFEHKTVEEEMIFFNNIQAATFFISEWAAQQMGMSVVCAVVVLTGLAF